MLRYLLFDLDNTLYPSSCGLDREIDRLMTIFVSDYLGISIDEALKKRKTEALPYGTTLQWLRRALGFTEEDRYFEAVHPKNVEAYIAFDPELPAMLDRISLPKAILTNSPREHADRVLKRLGIVNRFTRVMDIRSNGFRGKPYPEAYENALKAVDARVEEVLFIDDLPRYLVPFRDLGGRSLLVDETGCHKDADHGLPSIGRITELENYLDERR